MMAEAAAAAAMDAQMMAEAAAAAAMDAQMMAEADAAAAEKARMEADDALKMVQDELAAAKADLMAAEAEVARLEQAEADRLAGLQTEAERQMAATSRALYQTLDEKMQLMMQAPVMNATAALAGEIMATAKSIKLGDGRAADRTTALPPAGRADHRGRHVEAFFGCGPPP